jgi:hypothetical protein
MTLKDDLSSAFSSIGKEWKKAKRQADKRDRVSSHRLRYMRERSQRETIRDVAFQLMEEAYVKASGGSRYPANARQIYYAARPQILKMTDIDHLDSQYFTQTLLKDYMEEYRPGWNVVFDARGHITEPHTGETIGLGGLEVRQYITEFTNGNFDEMPEQDPPIMIETTGPGLRYGSVLFVEKEGFGSLLNTAKISNRYDIAIASTKGMPVSALCDLLSKMRAYGIKTYVIHDFDKWGFSIVSTLKRGTRGSIGSGEIVDLGFRLKDIAGLEREHVRYSGDPKENLHINGATKDEVDILCQGEWYGERVELNAMMSNQFIEWLERKLREHGIKKLIPENNILAAAYRRAIFLKRIREREEQIRDEICNQEIEIPSQLRERMEDKIKDQSEISWDEAIWKIMEEEVVD